MLYEVAPRDGLQNEAASIPTAAKIAFIDRLSQAGLPAIEVTAFVRPDRVPQLADAEAVVAGITRRPGTRYSALVPNLKGLERAATAGLTEVAVLGAASETFSRRNVNQSIDESVATCAAVARAADAAGIRVRAYLSTAFGCPFEGDVPLERVVTLAKRLADLGVFEVAVSDTIGVAHPGQVRNVLTALVKAVPAGQLALHFHDTRGMAVANVLAALDYGIRTFDASASGLGGCPFAPGASGNVATESLIYLLEGLGHRMGIGAEAVSDAVTSLEPYMHGRIAAVVRRPA
jgi:isopropylmalate/homocitrate/citramalate synthase